jgi:phosphoserine phosphatase RsbU/P
LLALITDGITEAERPDQEQFGSERALEYIKTHQSESADLIVGGLYDAVRKFSDGMPQLDDITLVICKAI